MRNNNSFNQGNMFVRITEKIDTYLMMFILLKSVACFCFESKKCSNIRMYTFLAERFRPII